MVSAALDSSSKKPWWSVLYIQVLIGIALGIMLGVILPEYAKAMQPLAKGFIQLIKMTITPLIFCTIVTGIAGTGSMGQMGRIGVKAIIYFEVLTTLALIIGLIIINIVEPGKGMGIDPTTLDGGSISHLSVPEEAGMIPFLLNLIPHSMVSAFAEGNILQVLLVALLFGSALSMAGSSVQPLVSLIDQAGKGVSGVITMIMRLSPLGAFGAMAHTVGAHGIESLASLAELMLLFYATCILFIIGVLGLICRWAGISIWQFLYYIREELLIVLGTSSSESVLPKMIDKMQKLGCEKSLVGLVIPTGYSFNLDGSSIYFTMAVLFIAQALGLDLTFMEQCTILAILLLTSKGAAGVTGSGFITLVATLASVDMIPVEGAVLIYGIDRFMSEARALTNLIGNGVATLALAKWENALDSETMHKVLADDKRQA